MGIHTGTIVTKSSFMAHAPYGATARAHKKTVDMGTTLAVSTTGPTLLVTNAKLPMTDSAVRRVFATGSKVAVANDIVPVEI